MPRKDRGRRVERGLYRSGDEYWACATSPGDRRAQWLNLGKIGIMEARRRRDEFAYKLANGGAPISRKKVTVREVADEWFDHLDELVSSSQLRPRAVVSYKDGVRLHVLPTLGSRQVASVGPDDLLAWHDVQRRSGAATWSIRARWMGLRGLLGYAARTGRITANPADVLTRREKPKPGRPKDRFLSPHEIDALLSSAQGVGSLTVPVLLFSGIRVAELLGLTWEDVDFEQSVIRVRAQMSRKGERVPLKTEAGRRDVILMAELVRRLRKHRLAAPFSGPTDLIIGNGVGRTLGYTRLRANFAGAAERAGLVGVTPHTCRHTFASILIDQGRDVEFVAQQLGHSSTKTTWDIYVHLFRAREHANAARHDLDAAFGRMLRGASDRSGAS
jgi:integrase